MKKIIFFIVGVCISMTATSQRIAVGKSASIQFSNEIKKLKRSEVLSFANKKFSGNKLALGDAESTNPDNTYAIGEIIITFFNGDKTVSANYLSETKTGLDEMSKKDKSYKSFIKTVNGNKILVINETWGNVENYNFFAVSENYAKELNGSLQFDKSDHNKATKILDDLLNSLKFAD